ncbi:hypothetical protein KP806_17000 [Paenibacillus sp. N4]|uniref:hypothetical protein n=1 Tax=Paenibacillus vietnamensis TaxID=2590547 RepID=UPI001CD0ADEC|nr:hypothetical protein [Paenibacillus vietnamensis]MCA0756757.1 hypothetical protein [Paenibacillus vietnamensis]
MQFLQRNAKIAQLLYVLLQFLQRNAEIAQLLSVLLQFLQRNAEIAQLLYVLLQFLQQVRTDTSIPGCLRHILLQKCITANSSYVYVRFLLQFVHQNRKRQG